MFARQVSREQLVPIMCGGTIPKLDREQLVPIVLGWPVPSLGREHLVPIMCGGTIPKLDREQLVSIVLGRPVPSLGREHLVHILLVWSNVLNWRDPVLLKLLTITTTVIDLFVRSVCVVRELPIVRSGHVSIVLVTHALFVHIMRKRAAAAGASADAIEDARDGEDPKAELIALILARQSPRP